MQTLLFVALVIAGFVVLQVPAVRAKVAAVTSAAAERLVNIFAPVVTVAGVELYEELLAAVTESARRQWPDLHPAEAVERYTVQLRGTNHWHRDQERKKEAEPAAAAAEAHTG